MNSTLMDNARIGLQLARICNSRCFRASGKIRDFLQFIVTETMQGRGANLKEYVIGITVYGRPPSFDPKIDSIVRVEAIKLRTRLSAYYAETGWADDLVISVPKGGYLPEIQSRGSPLVSGSAGLCQIAELYDVGSLSLFRRTPASISVASNCFLQARALNPSDLRGHIGLATSYSASLDIETVSPQDVERDFGESVRQGLTIDEDGSEPHVLASIWLTTVRGPGEDAHAELARAILLDPKSPVAHFWASALESASGAHESSLKHFEQATRYAPSCSLIRSYRGRALYYAGAFRNAIHVLDDVSAEDTNLAVGYLWGSLARTALGLHDEAINVALKAVQLSETSATLGTLAYVLARGGNKEAAEVILERLTADPPYGYVSPLQLGMIAEALDRKEDAARHLALSRRENAWALLWKSVDERLKRLAALEETT